ncbi:MAG TPA: hypothetical protein PLL69_06475, partial [Gemmatimonadales bacterium]|nr:hypothetical protein [Gemmatimonadales bacterium]
RPETQPPPPVLPTRFGVQCAGVTAPAQSTSPTPGYHPARGFISIPPLPVPRRMRGDTLEVRMLLRANGTVDSIQVLGATDSAYAARYLDELRTTAARSTIYPAVYQGCAVDSWLIMSVTLIK